MTRTPATDHRSPRSTTSASLLVLLSAACFGTIPIFTVLAARAGASLATTLAWRYLLAGAAFVIAARSRERLRLPPGRLREVILLGGVGQAMLGGLALSALAFIPAATMVFLFYTYPAWVTLFAALRRTEPLTGTRVVALLLSLGGIVAMVGAPSAASLDPRGVGLALAAAVLYALYIPLLNRLQQGASPYALSVPTVVTAGLIFVIAGAVAPALFGGFTVHLSPGAWVSVTGLAVLSTALAFILFLTGLPTLGPVRAAIISTLEPFVAALLQRVVLGQPLGAGTFAGGVLIASAVLLLQLRGAADAAAASVAGERPV